MDRSKSGSKVLSFLLAKKAKFTKMVNDGHTVTTTNKDVSQF